MALDFTALRAFVAKYRTTSPNVAKSFDEVELLLSGLDARIAKLETPVAPPPVDPPPPPPVDPPAVPVLGSEIDRIWPWLRAYALTAPTTEVVKPVSGTQGNPVVINARNFRPTSTPVFEGVSDLVVRGLTSTGFAGDGAKAGYGAKRLLVQLLTATDLSGTKPQGFNSQGGIEDSVLLGAVLGIGHKAGTPTQAHGAYLAKVVDKLLLASVLAYDQSGYGLHFYPGPYTGTAYVTNATILGSPTRNSVICRGDAGPVNVEIHNSILMQGVALVNDARLTVYDSCVPGVDLSLKNKDGSPVFVRCSNADPKLDANFKPTNSAGVTPDARWVPLHDARGAFFTRSCVGAIAY